MNTITPINPNPALYFQPITPNTKEVSFALQLNPKCKLGRLKFCYEISIFSGELWSIKANCLVNLCMYRVYGHKISRGCGVQHLEVDICGNILSEVTKFSVNCQTAGTGFALKSFKFHFFFFFLLLFRVL